MTALINLETGDKDDLQGKVLIYGTCTISDIKHKMGLYSTGSVYDLVHAMSGMPVPLLNPLCGEPVPLDALEECGIDHDDESNTYAFEIDANNGIESRLANADVLHIGEYFTELGCRDGLFTALNFYLTSWSDQLSQDFKAIHLPEQDGLTTSEHIDLNYMTPLCAAISQRDIRAARFYKESFYMFAKNFGKGEDAMHMAYLVEIAEVSPDALLLIQAFRNKLAAVHDKRFEEAAVQRDKIEELRGNTRTKNTTQVFDLL